MARIDRQHELEGYTGKVGRHLRLTEASDGRTQVHAHQGDSRYPHWDLFKNAVAYARRTQHFKGYVAEAEREHTTPFHVATADFLHPPEIREVDLTLYHGRPGDTIRIKAVDDVAVASVGILIVDSENHLIEMGTAASTEPGVFDYVATHQAPTRHVRVIVDAADLPGHLDEARIEKEL